MFPFSLDMNAPRVKAELHCRVRKHIHSCGCSDYQGFISSERSLNSVKIKNTNKFNAEFMRYHMHTHVIFMLLLLKLYFFTLLSIAL